MKVDKLKNMKSGWFVGNFHPSAYRTKDFEVCFRIHPKGEVWEHHFHKHITEINLLTKGTMMLQGVKLTEGDIFTLYPYEVADPEFLEDCHILCIKTPSIPSDKTIIKYEKDLK